MFVICKRNVTASKTRNKENVIIAALPVICRRTARSRLALNVVQWNPSMMDTIGNQHYNEVSITQGLPASFHVIHNHTVDHNTATFSELFFALYAGREG